MKMRTIHDAEIQGKTVLIRSDLNVPIENGVIQSNQRIVSSLATIQYVLEHGGKVVLFSHLGRPKAGEYDSKYSLLPVAQDLSRLLCFDVPLAKEYMQGILPEGQCVLCENIRFVKGEVENSVEIAQQLARLGDIFVMDAFGTAHRSHASTVGITSFLPSYAGILVEEEVQALTKAIESVEKPSLAIIGGSKVSSKLEVLGHLSHRMDKIIVGGGIANTFLAAAGYAIGKSLYEPDLIEEAKKIMKHTEILLPKDVGVVKEINEASIVLYKGIDSLEEDDIIVDVGMLTSAYYADMIETASTIVWNGPVGIFEIASMSYGTEALCRAIADSRAYSLAGGGDTISAIEKFGIAEYVSYISTGGGAFLEYIEGKQLPALAVLECR
ncbi:MAG: phosphoglycerate kinase [Desulfovibrionaceae bacterium]|nr:phosphoglycerate kinase [Desulfovibrionaceae bacterium]